VLNIRQTFVTQVDQSDCGVACLLSIIKYYKGLTKIEDLRYLSGTTRQGTSLLGLYQAAQKCGFKAEAIEANIDYLKSVEIPLILHVMLEEQIQHYVICYGYEEDHFTIGDPTSGVNKYTTAHLDSIWKSRYLLKLEPEENFKKNSSIKKEKKRWLLSLVEADLALLIIVSTISLVVSIIGLTMTIFSQVLIDKILPEGNKSSLISGILLIGIFQIIRGWFNYIRGHLLNIQNRDYNIRLIGQFYGSLLYLPKAFFCNRKIGELVARMEDTSRIQTVLAFIFGDLIKDVLLIFASIILVFYYSYIIAIILLCSFPFYFLIARLFHDRVVSRQFDVMKANAKKTSNYINTLQAIDTLKLHNKEDDFSTLNKQIYSLFQDKIFNLGRVGINLQFITDLVSVIIIITVLGLCSFMVLSKQLHIGELAALISISGSMLPSIGNLAFANIRIQGANVAFDRMYEFASISPEYKIDSSKDQVKTEINRDRNLAFNPNNITFEKLTLINLSFRFPGRKLLFKDISFEIEKGKITVLMGESGSGKTTLLYILEKFYQFESGSIVLNSIALNEISPHEWRNLIGVVPQEINIFNGSLLLNICLGSSTEELNRAYEFCVEFGFDKYFSTFPQSYATVLGEEGLTLSGGQKQLITLARALFKRPQLLLLDEPTSGMDSNTEQFVLNLLNKLRCQTGIFIISHRLSVAQIANYIYVLENSTIKLKNLQTDLMQAEKNYSESFKKFGL
jgi:ATP-binding cassette, subfamily C, bacteriocin exporter